MYSQVVYDFNEELPINTTKNNLYYLSTNKENFTVLYLSTTSNLKNVVQYSNVNIKELLINRNLSLKLFDYDYDFITNLIESLLKMDNKILCFIDTNYIVSKLINDDDKINLYNILLFPKFYDKNLIGCDKNTIRDGFPIDPLTRRRIYPNERVIIDNMCYSETCIKDIVNSRDPSLLSYKKSFPQSIIHKYQDLSLEKCIRNEIKDGLPLDIFTQRPIPENDRVVIEDVCLFESYVRRLVNSGKPVNPFYGTPLPREIILKYKNK